MRFKTFLESKEILYNLEDVPDFSSSNIEGIHKIGNVVFDQTYGLGAVGHSSNVNYRGFVVMMTPKTFLDLAISAGSYKDKETEYITDMIKKGRAIGSPFLSIDVWPFFDGSEDLAKVVGHEGRSRCGALINLGMGDTEIPIHIMPYGERRSRHMSDDMFAWLNDKGVIPESGGQPIINLFKHVYVDGKEKNF